MPEQSALTLTVPEMIRVAHNCDINDAVLATLEALITEISHVIEHEAPDVAVDILKAMIQGMEDTMAIEHIALN